jgi:uncharacterized protein
MQDIIQIIARELGKDPRHVANVVALLDEGNTIPFIARYRKELHGAMDDTSLRTLEERLGYLRGLQERRDAVKKSIAEQGKLTEELSAAIDGAATLSEVEDLYRPYKQKRRTRATMAREKGLGPLAELLFAQAPDCPEPLAEAARYVDPDRGVETAEDALAGASDIVAESISDDAEVRKALRALLLGQGLLRSQAAVEEDTVYRLYYDFSQPVRRLQGHQVLALNRGEKEGKLKVGVEIDRELALQILRRRTVVPGSAAMEFVKRGGTGRLGPAALPLPGAGDPRGAHGPGGRGRHRAVRPEPQAAADAAAGEGKGHHGPRPRLPHGLQGGGGGRHRQGAGHRGGLSHLRRKAEGARPSKSSPALVKKHGVEHIAIGNGTASRETEQMAVELIRLVNGTGARVSYMIVSEAGASVYSASRKLAAEEFPEYDVNLRSAVSIARRLQDPLAELVKIEPKAIGVGQYQHDMPEKRLTEALSGVVEDCVNAVGVDVNTASPSLLGYVAGLTPATAKNVVKYREENGAFTSRRQLLKVPKLGPKAFEQCAGFLRVPESRSPLDNTAVHPESYGAAEKLLELTGHTLRDAAAGALAGAAGGGGGHRLGQSGGGLRRGRAHPAGHRLGAGQARPGPPGRAAPAHPPHGRAGDEGSQARHGAHRHRAQRHRLRRLSWTSASTRTAWCTSPRWRTDM